VPAASWTDREVATVEAAASCWELAFGIPFVVDRESTASQRVTIDYAELTCTVAGMFTPGLLATIDVCPVARLGRFPLFTVLLHELGHAAGVRDEATRLDSVMGGALHTDLATALRSAPLAFSDEDEQLLASETRGPGGSCDGDVRLVLGPSGIPECVCEAPCVGDAHEPDRETTPVVLGATPIIRTLCVRPAVDVDYFVASGAGEIVVDVIGDDLEAVSVQDLPGRNVLVVAPDNPKRLPITYTIAVRAP